MPEDIRADVQSLLPAAVAVRRDLHEHAELSLEEHRTQAVILERLQTLGIEDVRSLADTGVTCIVRGAAPGPNLLWRADIDALPLVEDTGLPFASRDKAMHACGHDGHVAIGLALAEVAQRHRAALAGTVRFAFQPAEEHVGGARRMIDEGVMDSPKVDRAFGLHIWASLPVGVVGIVAGSVFAAATHFRIVIRGRGGHASAPHQAIDPIVVAAQTIVALQTVVSRNVDPEHTAVLTVGRIEGGVRGNIIPNEVMMSGTVRTFDARVLATVLSRIDEILRGVTAAFAADYKLDTSTLPAVVNDASAADTVVSVASEMLGAEHVVARRTTGGDDMAYFLERAPGAYFMLGGGNIERGITWPHHHPKFDFDEACLPLGIELGARIIEAETGSRLS